MKGSIADLLIDHQPYTTSLNIVVVNHRFEEAA
jgi:hypothetical protein